MVRSDEYARLTLERKWLWRTHEGRRGSVPAAAWAAAFFFNSYFSRIWIYSGVIGPAFSAYVFGVFFRGIFWGGFGGRFGVRRIFSDVFS